MTTAQLTQSGPSEMLLAVLRNSNRPLTIGQIKEKYDGPRFSEQQLREMLHQLVLHGWAFVCSPQSGARASRFWNHDEEQLTRDKVVELLQTKPLTLKKLLEGLRKQLSTGSSKNWQKQLILKMLQEGRFHEHPATGSLRSNPLALQPADPRDFIRKGTTLERLKKLTPKFKAVGISLEQILAAVGELIRSVTTEAQRQHDSRAATGPIQFSGPADHNGTEPDPTETPGERQIGLPLAERQISEIDDLILKGMSDIEVNVSSGSPADLIELRRHMPREYQGHDIFDAAVLRLSEQGKVVLLKHDEPDLLPETERELMVKDKQGNYYVYIAQRP